MIKPLTAIEALNQALYRNQQDQNDCYSPDGLYVLNHCRERLNILIKDADCLKKSIDYLKNIRIGD